MKIIRFSLPELLLAIIILSFAGTQSKLCHSLDYWPKYMVFLNKGSRNNDVVHCYYGLQQTGQPLLRVYENTDSLGFKKQSYCQVEAFGDDLGIYYTLPLLIRYLGLCPAIAYDFFFVSIAITGFLIGITGLKLLYRDVIARIISYVYMTFFTFVCFYILDVYIWVFLEVSFIPLFLWVIKKSTKEHKLIYLFIAVLTIGTIIGIGNQFRSHSGTGLLLFVLTYIILMKKDAMKARARTFFIMVLLISTSFSGIYFYFVLQKRDAWLRENNPSIMLSSAEKSHIVWHSIYIGLGYIKNNKFGIVWRDWCAISRADSVDPSLNLSNKYPRVMSSRYEKIIKDLYFSVLKDDPVFVLKTYLLKSLKVILELLTYFNIGLILLFLVKPTYRILAPFLISIVFYAIPGVLVWPFPMYFWGAISLCVYALLLLINEYFERESRAGY